ncbi:MAG: hypothetical protein WBM40_05660 [Thiohalocapsa sp.]
MDWTIDSRKRWTAPVHLGVGLGVGKILRIGKQSASITLRGVSNVVRPNIRPSWALNFQFALFFP